LLDRVDATPEKGPGIISKFVAWWKWAMKAFEMMRSDLLAKWRQAAAKGVDITDVPKVPSGWCQHPISFKG
jgi:hypothetical protein